jgi:hypothetical protein
VVCPFREQPLPAVLPQRGELWRLTDGHLAQVHMVTICIDRRLSFAYVCTRMRNRNVPLQAFLPPAYRCHAPELW